MNISSYVLTAMTPSFVFMLLSLPVKNKNILQESVLALLWMTGLSIPIYYAGRLPYICLMSTAVWTWASSMKMGVWLFSMSMEERRQRPFYMTMLDWRKRSNDPPTTEEIKSCPTTDHVDIHLRHLIWKFVKHQFYFDAADVVIHLGDAQRIVRVFSAVLSNLFAFLGQKEKADMLAPTEPLTWGNLLVSTLMAMLFCVYIQMQLQVAYDECMIGFGVLYKTMSVLERWQLGQDLGKLHAKNTHKAKMILKRVCVIRAIKSYIEDTLNMPPPFDSPWSAHSLRDFWGRRWHTYYNDCFYRLGYRPIRAAVMFLFHCKPPRWLPALSVFVMSGLMHEYFLVATGSKAYLGHPLPACGLQFFFFVIQVLLIGISDKFFSRGPIGRLYTIFCMALTSHFFVVPYVLTGYLHMERLSFFRLVVHLYQGNPNLFASVDL
ncbi:hypothetical protein CU098_011789 [Rhizopus stolonifer]|uniref:Wax synthase domain-containing protein n=2 Tax=Mucorineae TaxID=1344963 RepID=A0A367KJ91_RHIST|nr:hypothetical protein CU098_011789 [Rhizopus stolonifer]